MNALSPAITYPIAVRSLFFLGGDVGLGNSVGDCSFYIEINEHLERWGIFQTLARIHEFSEAAQKRILSDCSLQIKYPGPDVHGEMPT